MGNRVVDVIGVYKSYRRGNTETPVLEGIDFQVTRGEIVYLTGPSGCGKTTLLSILGCILSPDRGHVRVLGQTLAALENLQRPTFRRERIGFVFQRFHLIRGLNAVDNVSVPLLLGGTNERCARAKAIALLDEVGLKDMARCSPDNLSAGQCQRIGLARALACDPDLILADEPTASLDAANGQQVIELMSRLTKKQGKTAIVVTHDSRIYSAADRICAMEDGQLTDAELPTATCAAVMHV